LTATETSEIAAGEHTRNYKACVNGFGYCDKSKLTAAELKTVSTPTLQ